MKRATYLGPIRVNSKGELEVLLTRRNFISPETGLPMQFPGEWHFTGGKQEEEDPHDIATGHREFRQETGYTGQILDELFLRSGDANINERIHVTSFYGIRINPDPTFEIPENGEIIDIKWDTPENWLKYIKSKEFDDKQKMEIDAAGLGDISVHGKHAIHERQIHRQTLTTLGMIRMKSDHLRPLYADTSETRGKA